ncbi:hypothetical protein A5724_10505 [Mycobacterium sp. ACS1612]|uniref:hypothetical protein n=1 Tax=Mycobacterium sp. ACS1612 TaxID=1834117 RepID=UPI0008009036|nr:hypothetical protein [Mycobacterium sp. ACS1612]OBF38151.1 hypothetical protein A5724_10505 [Mycobacterium sp. ACS1612]
MTELDTATKQAIADMTDDDYRAWRKSMEAELRPPTIRPKTQAGLDEARRRSYIDDNAGTQEGGTDE